MRANWIRPASWSTRVRFTVIAAASAVFALGVGASEARPASGPVTISMLWSTISQPGMEVLIANFERAYPGITVDATYEPNTTLYQLETTELAAGSAPDLMYINLGCGAPVAACDLASAGDLAPIVDAPWTKRSLPLVTSASKYGVGLYAFETVVAPAGMFTNDALFAKLGLKVPQTFAQLLTVCQKAKEDGTAAVILAGGAATMMSNFILDLAAATVYGPDRRWNSELNAGTVSFDTSPGWHEALQEVVDMNDAGCFQPGAAAASSASEFAAFAQGQGLMAIGTSVTKGSIDALTPPFSYPFHPFPVPRVSERTRTFLLTAGAVGVNAHASAANQVAAQTFIDFLARPDQDALYAKVTGGLTQYEFLKGEIPSFMSAFTPILKDGEYVILPSLGWWNPGVINALQTYQVGLLTGESSIDDILNAMDAAWKQGPA